MAEKKTSPWVYIGCGCLLAVVIAVVAGIGGCWFIGKKAVEFGESMSDPAARQERVLDVLGASDLPEGYEPIFGLSIPFLFDIALVGTGEVNAQGEPQGLGDEGLVYVKMLKVGPENDQQLQDFFEGRTNNIDALKNSNINVNVEQMIGRGTLSSGNMDLRYVTSRGGVSMDGPTSRGLVSVVLIGCEADDKQRIGIWYGPDPAPAAAPEEVDLTGTVGDEARMQQFFDRFDLCR